MNKTQAVLNHMKENGSITSLEAIELYGATRLSGIIFNLRKRGYDIDTQDEGCIDRFGSATTYGRYFLNEGWESLEEERQKAKK